MISQKRGEKVLDCQEYKEIIAAHVDGDLSPNEMLAAQGHLDQCPKCTQMFHWETEVKDLLKQGLSLLPARRGLKEKILDQLGETRMERFFGWFNPHPVLIAASALLLVVALHYLFWQGEVHQEVLTDAIAQYQKVTEGIVEAQEAASSPTPAARLLDLSPWGYRVLARQSQQVRGQEGRVFVYQGQGKEYLVAQEFDGADFSPPAGARIIRASNREFVSYSQEGVNLIAFKEKDVLCILSATLPEEKLLGLAQQLVMAN